MSQITTIWKQLADYAAEADRISIAAELAAPGRLGRFSFQLGGVYADLSRHLVTDDIMAALLRLCDEAKVAERAAQLARGEPVNVTEQRRALHMGLRNPDVVLLPEFAATVADAHSRLASFSNDIRSGSWSGTTGERITDVINIGIGGSDLGPKMAVNALREFHDGPALHFISNVDGAEINDLLKKLNAATTLIIISSKTFTTLETRLNADTALSWLSEKLGLADPQSSPHCIAITAAPKAALDFGVAENRIVTFPESIGGRYSIWSGIGLPICIALGFEKFQQFLAGGAIADRHFLTAAPQENIPMLMAVLGIWYNNFLGAQSCAVIPYCERLGLLVNHLQQLDMESNGKSVQQDGQAVATDTAAILWGQTGTNGQHAFFQLLHQGTRLVPVDFVGVVHDPLSHPDHHRVLLANMIAQSEALMAGSEGAENYRHCPGNRPSATFLLDTLDPYSLGTLLALYEHKVFVQGCIWSINSFDQWGVELGKTLASRILDSTGAHDPSTTALLRKTGLAD